MLSCKDGVENRLTLFVTCDESMTPFVLLRRDDSFSDFFKFDPFSFPFQITTLSPLHTKAVILEAIHQHIYPNCGQVDGTFIQPTRLRMRSIDGVDEFEIVVVCTPLSIVEKLNKSISGVNGDCLDRIMWIRMVDITTSTTPYIVSKSLEGVYGEMKIQTSFWKLLSSKT